MPSGGGSPSPIPAMLAPLTECDRVRGIVTPAFPILAVPLATVRRWEGAEAPVRRGKGLAYEFLINIRALWSPSIGPSGPSHGEVAHPDSE